jgi:hypothetical protein
MSERMLTLQLTLEQIEGLVVAATEGLKHPLDTDKRVVEGAVEDLVRVTGDTGD